MSITEAVGGTEQEKNEFRPGWNIKSCSFWYPYLYVVHHRKIVLLDCMRYIEMHLKNLFLGIEDRWDKCSTFLKHKVE